MARALMVGMTDYSHQSFEDMIGDLENWIDTIQEVIKLLENYKIALIENGFWDQVSYSVSQILGYSFKFFDTGNKELSAIFDEIKQKVEENHIRRLHRLATTASKLDKDIGRVWHQDSNELWKDYGNPKFKLVENMYAEARGMAQDMRDLGALSARLKDFIGKEWNTSIDKDREERNSVEFINAVRLNEIRTLSQTQFDLSRLIEMCEELNTCYSSDCFLVVAMLTRAVLDHVPPIFSCKNFSEVANNYKGSKSFKECMKHLNNSSRKIADAYLHEKIRKKESLPNKTQVNFSSDIDMLLGEIVRILK